jgi:hypothetical protein
VKDDRLYLQHVLDAIDRVEVFTKEGKDEFLADLKTQDAVVRNLEVIGEAVKNLSPDTTATKPEIPWREIAGMRDKVIHHYFGVDLAVVWDSVENDLPKLKRAATEILKSLPTSS